MTDGDDQLRNIAGKIPEKTRRLVLVKESPFKSTGSH